jgi:hypothetical protein
MLIGKFDPTVYFATVRNYFFTILLLATINSLFAQINNQGRAVSNSFTKDAAEYRVKEFLVRDVLEIPENRTIEISINALTASRSGELTTIIYDCKQLGKSGLVFGFWSDYIKESNQKYQGYAFKNFDLEKAKDLLDNLDKVLEEKRYILPYGSEDLSKNVLFKFEDTIFIFYKDNLDANLIRVVWNGFDLEWNETNLKTMKRRFYRYFVTKK